MSVITSWLCGLYCESWDHL